MINDSFARLMLDASNSAYNLGAESVPTGFIVEQPPFDDPSTGFSAVAFFNPQTNERILAFTGTRRDFQEQNEQNEGVRS